MSKAKKKYRHYKRTETGKSVIDGSPTLVLHQYIVPKSYRDAVSQVISGFRQGISFNSAVDQVALLYPDTINRNKLAEHTIKSIANDY